MKHKLILGSAAVLALSCFAGESAGQTAQRQEPSSKVSPATNAPSPVLRQKVAEGYGRLPLSFEANQGQSDPRVKFLSRGPGYQLFLLPDEAVLTLRGRLNTRVHKKDFKDFRQFTERPEREANTLETIRMSLLGAAAHAQVTGIEEMPGKSNYFVGNDPSQWRTSVPNYAKVRYHGVYPGIDLVYHGSRQQLEYDFIVSPGADPRRIRLALHGAKKLELTSEGDLLLSTSGEPVRLHKPVIYQELGGKRMPIDGSFVLVAKNTVRFRIGKYDTRQSLVIDPVLAYSTLLGGNGFDQAFGIAVDSTGAAYVTGSTTSTDFFTPGAFLTALANCGTPAAFSPCEEAFVAKLSPTGNSLAYVTYLGGTGLSQGAGVATFGGNAYVTGTTSAKDFPTTPGAFQNTLPSSQRAFVTELNAAGSALVFSTYLGGTAFEFFDLNGGPPIAVDSSGNAYVTGTTFSSDFPTPNGFQTDPGGGAFRSADSSATWTASVTGLTSRSITAFAVDPTVPTTQIVYAGTSDKELFKSTNGGQSWVSASGSGATSLSANVVQALVIDPRTPTNLYVGGSNGAFKTTDGGATWAAVDTGLVFPGTATPVDVRTLAIDPTTTGTTATLYAGGFEGAFKTTNGGATWTSLNAGFPLTNGLPTTPEITSIVVDPLNPSTVYAGVEFPGGVFKSSDGGATWTAVSNGLVFPNTTSPLNIRTLAIDVKAPANIYATTFNGVGVYKTSNGGLNWGAVNNGLTDLQINGIAVDSTVSGTLYVGTQSTGVFKTVDGGANWTTATNALSNFIVGSLAVDPVTPTNVYAGSSVERTYVAKFSSSGAIGYATYLGGSSLEFAGGIAVDGSGNAYLTGATDSRNFPTTPGAFRTTRQSIFDAYVTKLNAAGSPVYSTYLDNPDGFSEGFGIAVDGAGSAYITGVAGPSYPTTPGAFQTVNPADNAFVTKLSLDGTALVYSTFLGGPGGGGGFAFTEGRGIALDTNGNAWVTGITEDFGFPTVNPIRASTPCAPALSSSCFFFSPFVSEVKSDGSSLLFSTYLGPTQFFTQGGIAVDSQGNAYISGNTSFTEFPMVNPLPGAPLAGSLHGFVTKIATTGASTDLSITLSHSPDPVTIGQNITFTSTIKNNNPPGGASATGVTFYPTQVPNSTIHLFKTLAAGNLTNPATTQGTCDANEFCSIGTLAPGASATVTMVVSTFTGQEGIQTVAVGVGGNESDSTPANNTATTTVNVLGAVDLQLVATATPAPVLVGNNLTYQLIVTNTAGPSPATGVVLTDTLPSGVNFVPAASTPGCAGTTTIVCALGTLPVGGTAVVNIVVTPTVAGTITNNSVVTSNEVNNSAGKNVFKQISDVVAGVGANNPNNTKLNGHYAFLFQGAEADSLMAFAGSFVADGNGNLTNGISDTNATSGLLINQSFTGTYNVGPDNRGTMIITITGGAPQTYRFALGAFNAQNIATKARFIDFDAGRKGGAGVIEMQDPSAFSAAAIKGNFAFGVSGENGNASHFAAAGRFTTDGVSLITGGQEDTDTAGLLNTNVAFSGTYNVPLNSQNGRGAVAFTFTGPGGGTLNFAVYLVSANEAFVISTDQRSLTVPLSSGQALRQQTANFTNSWLNGKGVFNLSGTPTGNTETHVTVGLATTDGFGDITVLSDENDGGLLILNHTGSTTTYSVTSTGRTTFTGGTSNPILYLVDLNRGFLVGTDVDASTGSLEPQVGGPFSNATVSGNIFLGSLTPNALSVGPFIGEGSTDGAGNFVATEDGVTPTLALFSDAVATDTFVVSPNGRAVTGSGGVFYLVSPGKSFSIGAKSGKTNELVTVSESSALPTADLSLTKSASVSNAVVGEQFSYTLTVKNNGPGPATGVLVTDLLPPTVTFVSASATQGVCNTSSPVFCSLGAIPNGASVDIFIVVTAASAGSAGNTASVTANEPDPNLVNNTESSGSVTIFSFTDLAVAATATPDSVIVNSNNLTFTITVTNVGNLPATNILVTDTLPAGVTVIGLPTGCSQVSNTLTCNLGTPALAGGGTVILRIGIMPTAVGTITHTATVTFTEQASDPTLNDNTASASATVLPSAGTSERYLLTDRNSPSVLEYDTATNTLQATAHAGSTPEGIAISPNGRLAFVGNLNSNYVSVIDLTLNAEIARIRGVRAFRHLALNGDGTKLVVPNLNLDEVDIIDTSTFQILSRVSINGLVGDDPNNPNDIGNAGVVTAGNFAYIDTNNVVTGTPTRIAVIDLTTFAASSIPGTNVGSAGARDQIAATPDGRWVVVPRRGPASLLIIDAARNILTQTVNLAANPFAITITRDAGDLNGVFGYVTTRAGAVNAVSVLDLRSTSVTFGQLVTGAQITIPAPLNPSKIGITADGNHVIVAAFAPTAAQNNVFVLDTNILRGPVPANSIVAQFRAGGALPSLEGIDVGLTQSQPPVNAPVVTAVSTTPVTTPPFIVNDAARQVHISGTGFATGALVRVGSLDPIAPSSTTATDLFVTLPQFTPAQNLADVIVTNPSVGGVDGQWTSGILPGVLTITNGLAFQPTNEVTVSDFGDNAVGIFNNATKSVINVSTSPRPLGEAISVDGLRAYVGSLTNQGTAAVNVINLNSKTLENTIPMAADTFIIGQTDAIVTAPNPATGGPAEFLLTGYTNAATGLGDLRVVLIDSDSTSPTFNTIVASFNAGLTTDAFPGALAVTSDGHFAYANDGNTGNLVVFNLLAGGAATVVPVSALSNANVFQGHFELTQDNKSLILISSTGSMLVFDIGANPIGPALVTTITGTPPAGLQPLFFNTFHVVGKRLYAYDPQGVVQAFNFDRATPNFTVLGSVTIPGVTNLFGSGLGVTPDGALLYAALDQEDSLAVIDTTQLVASSPSAVITKIHVGLSPTAIIISPGQALVAALAITKTAVPTTVTVGTPVTYTMTVTNSGPSASSGVTVTDVLPTGLTFVSATPSQGSCSGTTTITCSLGQIANGASASVSITATVTGAAASTTINTATVAENETNSTPASATASVNITVTGASVCTGTIRWTGSAGDGQWTTPTNWDQTPARIPAPADDVCIDATFAGTRVRLANSQQTIRSLITAAELEIFNPSNGASLTITGANSTFLSGLFLTGGVSLNSSLTNTVNGVLTVTLGPSTIAGSGNGNGTLIANGGFSLSSGSNSTNSLTINGGVLTNNGPATLAQGSLIQLVNGAALNNSAGAALALSGASIASSGSGAAPIFNNSGSLASAGASSVTVQLANTGTVSANNGTLTVGAYFQTGGTTALNGGNISGSLNINGGALVGTGAIVTPGSLVVNSGGVISPGFSPGTITVAGTFGQGPTGTYKAEIGGRVAGTQYDQVSAGNLQLAGALNVSLINGFVPAVGDSFTILNCLGSPNCLTGTFTTVNFPALPNGLRWNIAYSANSVVLSVSATAPGCASGSNQWTGTAGDNQWATPGNWSVGVPVATDNVCIGTNFANSTITIGSLAAANQTIASLNANSTITFNPGPLTVSGAATFANALNLSGGGTLTLNGTSTVQGATTLSGGTLTGAGSLSLTGLLTWNAGAMAGTGATTANGGIAVSFISAGAPTLGRTLTNNGTATFNANPLPFSIVSGGNFINSSGSTMDIQTDGVNVGGGGNTGTITNAGTIMKSGGTGAGSSIDVNLISTGPIQVKSGTLTIDTVNGLTSAAISGATTVAAGATLNFNGVGATVSGTVSGAGSVSASFSTVTFSGAYTVSGTTTLATVGTTLNFNGPGATLGPLTLLNGSVVNFNVSGTVTAIGAVTISGSTANFSSGTATVNLASLGLTQGGVLTGTNNLTIAGTSTLNQGTISGTGTITANGPVAFNVPPFNFPLVLDARTFTANAGVTMTSTAPVQLQNGAIFVNSAASLFDIQGPAGITFGGGATATFNNLGTFQRSTGAGTVPVAVAFNNSGTVTANSGTLNFSGGGTGAGAFNVTSGATLGFTGGTFTLSGSIAGAGALTFAPNTATLSGAYNVTGGTTVSGGTVHFTGPLPATGPLTINGGTADFTNIGGSIATAPTITLSGGTLTGADTVSVTGLLTWTGGTMSGAGITNANGGMSIPQNASTLDTRTLNISGNTTFGGANGGSQLFVQNGAVINNLAGSAWNFVNGSNSTSSGIFFNGAAGTFNNAGTFQMTGGTGNAVTVPFNNSGTVNANAGILTFFGGGSCAATCVGAFNVASGATLGFGSGTFALAGNIAGAGTVNFAGGTANLTGTYNVTGGTTVSGGTANFTGTLTNAGPLTISGGTANFSNASGAVTTSTLTLSSGTLTGTSNVTVTGLLTWAGGTMSGTGTAFANGGMSVPQNASILDTRTLNISGNTTFGSANGGSQLFVQNGAVINNLAGSAWNFVNGSNSTSSGIFFNGAAGTFNNAGTFQMTGGTGNAVTVPFNNSGTVSANAGTLSFTGVYTQPAGSGASTLLNGGSITASATGLNINGGTLGGTGSITGNVSVTTGGLLSPGFSPGTITLNGGYTQSNTGSYLVEIAGLAAGTQYDQLSLTNNNIATLGGTLNVALLNGFTPAAGDSFTIVTCVAVQRINGTFATTNFPTLPNGLTWNITYNTNSVVLSVVSATGVSITKTTSLPTNTTHVGAGNFSYTVTVTNNTASPATNVTVTDPLPPGVTLVSAAASQGTCGGTTTISCPIGSLASGVSAAVTITVTPTAIGSAVNTATVAFNGTGSNSATATVQIQGTADLMLTKTGPLPNAPGGQTLVNAGSNLTYTLTVSSLGPDNATGVTLTDPLPAGATFVSAASTQGTCSGTATVSCALGNMSVDSVVTVTIVVTVTGSGPLTNTASVTGNEFDPNTANNTSSATVTVVPVADLALSASATPNPDSVGNPLTVTFTVVNKGPSPATSVFFSAPIPAGATLTNAIASQGSCDGSSCPLGPLAVGANASVTLTLNPTAVGTLTVTGNVTATETDPNPNNNSASATVPITASSDLAVTQTVASPILFGTANVVYRVTVTNNGPSQADNITLTDVLTGNIVDESISAVCSESPAFTFTCVFSLASGASQQFTVVAPPTAAGTFTNTASVSSANFDANPANNTSTASAIVNPSVDLSLTVNAPQAAFVGNNITFTYTIQNNQNSGLSNATGVTLTDTLPSGLSFVPSSSSPGCSGIATITCNVGALAKGATASVSIVVRVDAAGKFTNTASVSATEPDLFPSNNTAINTFAANASADLGITIASAPATPAVGVNLTFTMTVANNGPSPATGVLVVGAFTTGATIVSITPSQGPPCTGTTQFNCNLGALASGSSAKIIAVVTPTVGGQFGTTDSVQANEPDPNPANNSQTLLVNVISAPTVTLSASNVTFASQPVGTSSTPQIVTLTNTSPVLPITNLVIAPSGDFSETDNCGTGLAPLAFCGISITFKPSATGTRTGAITLTDNALGSPQMIALTGSGIVAPAITLSPGSLVFSSRLVGTSSSPLPVSLTNSGNATLNIASIAITGTNAGDFSQTNTCGSTLGAGLTCAINVVFKPTDGGQRTAGVAITSDARGSVPVVTLSGTGLSIGLGLSSSLLIFDSQTVGTTSPAQTVTLSNASASAIAISSITVTGDYAQTNNCGSSVAASSSCSIQITFTPTLTGSRPGTLSVAGADSANPHTVTLSGVGAVVTLSLSPTSLTFADQTVGTSSQAQGILLTNTGATALTISSIVPSGDFLESNTCGAGLAAGANCTISVNFLPTSTGTRTGSITITSNAQGSPHTVKLTGNGVSTGPAVSLSCPAGAGAIVHRAVAGRTAAAAAAASSCTSLSFPAQAVGSPSTPLTVVLTNVGNAPLTGIGVSATGDFAASSACVSPLAPAASCNISVTFTPTDTGTRAGSLTIQDNAGDSPQSLLLNGTGTPSGPAVTLSTTALPFGNQLLGTTSSPAQTVTVTNTGTATLTFTSIKASGDFAETDNCSAGVPANSSCTISVTFTPNSTGARAGAITISDNAPANPQSVTLSGEGTDIAIAPPPGSSTSASLSPGQMATFPLSIAPSGGFNGPVTVTCTGAIPAGTCSSSPSSFTLDSVVTVTTTVTTTAPSKSMMMMLPDADLRLRTFPRWLPRNLVSLRALAQSLVALLALLMFALAVRRRRRGWLLAVAGLFLFALASGISGCAGGSGNPGVVGQTSGTPAGTYTVTVVVKTSTGATRSLPLTITVH
jgi:uncharacterized repeat protein (TIGR01451 family)